MLHDKTSDYIEQRAFFSYRKEFTKIWWTFLYLRRVSSSVIHMEKDIWKLLGTAKVKNIKIDNIHPYMSVHG